MKTIHKQNEFNRCINHKKESIINSREAYNCTERKKNYQQFLICQKYHIEKNNSFFFFEKKYSLSKEFQFKMET